MRTEYRVYGPPGTGKTTHIADRVRHLAEEFGEDQVSICSLTNTAVREAVGRDLPLHPDNVSTLHARCKRSLNAPAPAESRIREFIENYPRYATSECIPPSLLRRRSSDADPETIDEALVAGSRAPTLYERVQILRQQRVPPSEWQPELRAWFDAWDDFMTSSGSLDFTGWLEAALTEASLPAQQVVFIDEAQDHTPLQLEVIRNWRTRHLVLVGDDDQNLYEWSGAIPSRFFNPPLPEERETVLSQSYRVPRAVHERAQRWISRLRDRREKRYFPRDFDGEILYGFSLGDLEYGRLPDVGREGTHMFLTSAGYMLEPLIEQLLSNRVPFHNPYRRGNARWNPIGTLGPALDDFLLPMWTGRQAHNWLKYLRSGDVFQRGKRKEALEWLKSNPREHVYLSDLSRWLLPNTVERIDREDVSLFRMRRTGAPGAWDYVLDLYQRPTEERRPRIVVGTIHSVKGGQADHVYLMPDLSPAAFRDWSGPYRDRITRLMYVGMTRAACTLHLGRPSSFSSVNW